MSIEVDWGDAVWRSVDETAAMLPRLYEGRVDRNAFQALLAVLWRRDGFEVAATAKTRSRLLDWFRYADFRNPGYEGLKGRVEPTRLPHQFVAYRGGFGSLPEALEGLSWSTDIEMAAWFVRFFERYVAPPGDPVLLRTVAKQDQALAYFGMYGEVVMGELTAVEVITRDRDAIRRLGAGPERRYHAIVHDDDCYVKHLMDRLYAGHKGW